MLEKMEPANLFDLFYPFAATQRIALVLESVPFTQLLFHVANISYRKAADLINMSALDKAVDSASSIQVPKQLNNVLKKISPTAESRLTSEPIPQTSTQKIPIKKSRLARDQTDRPSRTRRAGGTGIRTGSRRVIEDDSTEDEDDVDDEDDSDDDTDENELAQNRTDPSDDSDNEDDDEDDEEDDDSEPLLGKWFEETLFPPDEEAKNINGKKSLRKLAGKICLRI